MPFQSYLADFILLNIFSNTHITIFNYIQMLFFLCIGILDLHLLFSSFILSLLHLIVFFSGLILVLVPIIQVFWTVNGFFAVWWSCNNRISSYSQVVFKVISSSFYIILSIEQCDLSIFPLDFDFIIVL